MSTGVLPNQQCIFGAKKFAHGQEIVDEERPGRPVFRRQMQRLRQLILSRSERGLL